MNWFKKHINLTMTLYATASYILIIIFSLIGQFIPILLLGIANIMMCIWVVDVKGRSKWFIILNWIPLGMYFIATMDNRKTLDRHAITSLMSDDQ